MRKSEARGERGLAKRAEAGETQRRHMAPEEGLRQNPLQVHVGCRRTPARLLPSPSFPLSSPEDSRIPQGRWPRLRGLPGWETWVHRTPGAAAPPLDSAPREPPGTRRRGRRDLTPSGWAESREGARAPGDAQQRERRRSPARAGAGCPRVASAVDVAQLLVPCQPA